MWGYVWSAGRTSKSIKYDTAPTDKLIRENCADNFSAPLNLVFYLHVHKIEFGTWQNNFSICYGELSE